MDNSSALIRDLDAAFQAFTKLLEDVQAVRLEAPQTKEETKEYDTFWSLLVTPWIYGKPGRLFVRRLFDGGVELRWKPLADAARSGAIFERALERCRPGLNDWLGERGDVSPAYFNPTQRTVRVKILHLMSMLRSLCTAQSAPSTVCLLGYIATNRTCTELLEKYCE